MHASAVTTTAPYTLLPPPSRCGLSTHASGLAVAAAAAASPSAFGASDRCGIYFELTTATSAAGR